MDNTSKVNMIAMMRHTKPQKKEKYYYKNMAKSTAIIKNFYVKEKSEDGRKLKIIWR